MDSGVEVTIQVAVARDGVVMEEATVQLDEEPELSVADIAVDGSSIGCIGQDADRPQTTGLVRRNIDGRMLDANPWRTRVPVDPPVQIGAAAYPITGHISQRALDGNGDLDPRLVGVTPARTDRGAQRRVS